MKASRFAAVWASCSVILPALAVDDVIKAKGPVRERPPVFRAPGAEALASTNSSVTSRVVSPNSGGDFSQQSLFGMRSALVSREQVQAVTERFKRGYAKLGNPRIVISVNRELVDETGGLTVAERREKREVFKADLTADPSVKPGTGQLGSNVTIVGNVAGDAGTIPSKGTTERVTAENTYRREAAKPVELADKQTVRDVERLFGRPFRMGGAKLADHRIASQLLQGHSIQELLPTASGTTAARDREALLKVADVVIEVLISSKSLTVPGVAGDATYPIPDIQATAMRLVDAQILGQASSSDILGPDRSAGRMARQHDMREITEATALALMEDMMQGIE